MIPRLIEQAKQYVIDHEGVFPSRLRGRAMRNKAGALITISDLATHQTFYFHFSFQDKTLYRINRNDRRAS